MFVSSLSRMRLKCKTLNTQILELRLLSDDCGNPNSNHGTLLKQLGFSDDESKIFTSNKQICMLSPRELKRRLDMLQKLGYTKNHFLFQYPNVLRLQHTVVDQRFKILEESGVSMENITLDRILRYTKLSKRSVSVLKKQGILDAEIDVSRHILSYCDLPSNMHPFETDEQQTFREIQVDAAKCYLRWLLDFSKEEINNKFKTYYLYNKSIRLMKQIFDILNDTFEFPKEKIGRHFYLFQTHPENLLDMLERVPVVGVKPLKSVANWAPKILLRPTDTILEILQIFKEHNVDEKNLAMHPEIFTLAPETVRTRINIFYTDPHYKYLVNNTRIFKCISNFRDSSERAAIIRAVKWRCYSADILAANRTTFDERLKMKPEGYGGIDIVYFLQKELDMSHKEVHSVISQHPLWHYVPLVTISATLELLRCTGFTRTQIASALPVVLYPKDEVEKSIKRLDQDPEVDCCRDPLTGRVRPEYALQVVLYYLERPFHFTGNGVWELDQTNMDQAQ